MLFNIYEIHDISTFDATTKQIEVYANSIGKDLDNNQEWVKAHTLITELEWNERKDTHMLWRRVQALLDDVVATL